MSIWAVFRVECGPRSGFVWSESVDFIESPCTRTESALNCESCSESNCICAAAAATERSADEGEMQVRLLRPFEAAGLEIDSLFDGP